MEPLLATSSSKGIATTLLRFNTAFRDTAVLLKFALTSLSILLMFEPGKTAFITCSSFAPPYSSSVPPFGSRQVQRLCEPYADFNLLFGTYMITFGVNIGVFVLATIIRSRNLFHKYFRGVCLAMVSVMMLTSLANIFIIFSINFISLKFHCDSSNTGFSNAFCTDKWFNYEYVINPNTVFNYTETSTLQCASYCSITQPSYFQPLILSFLYFFSLILSYYADNVERERAEKSDKEIEGGAVVWVGEFYARHHNLIQDLAAFVKFTLTSVVIYLILASDPIGCVDAFIPNRAASIPGQEIAEYCLPTISSGQLIPQMFLYLFVTNLTAFIIIVFIRHQNAMSYSYKSVSYMILLVSILMTAAKISLVFIFIYSEVLFSCYPASANVSSGIVPVGLCSNLVVSQNLTGSYGFLNVVTFAMQARINHWTYNDYLPSWLEYMGNYSFPCKSFCKVLAPNELYSLTLALVFSLLYTVQVIAHYYARNAATKKR